jgi:hypothetical protein
MEGILNIHRKVSCGEQGILNDERRRSGEQEIRGTAEQENGEFRMEDLELRISNFKLCLTGIAAFVWWI